MRSPSGAGARRRGGTHAGKAPLLPKTTIFGLTRGQLFGEDLNRDEQIYPRLCRTCGPPLRRAVSFLGSRLQRLSANHFAPSGIPHRGKSAVKRVGGLVLYLANILAFRSTGGC